MDFAQSPAPRAAAATPPVAKASPSPVAEVATPEVIDPPPPPADPNVCPCGKAKGKRFDELPTATLEAILDNAAKFPAVTADHKNAIIAVLGDRESAGVDAEG